MLSRGAPLVAALLASCGGAAATGPAATTNPTGTTAGGTVLVTAPAIPRAAFDVAPGELADGDVYTRIRHRARLAREGTAYLRGTGERIDDTGHADLIDERPIVPVLGETAERIRIVAQEDGARFALWVPRSDTAETVLAPVQLADPTGHAPAGAGVWLGAGASLDADERAGAAGFREVTLRGHWLAAKGYVPAEALGHVWIAGEREGFEPSAAADDNTAPVPTGKTIAPTILRAAPDGGAAVVAQVLAPAPVRVTAAHGAWAEVEVHAPRVRARGFAQTSAITDGDTAAYHAVGHGHGFGTTLRRIAVPRGACLYDAASGEVMGVQITAGERFMADVARAPATPGWPKVMLDTMWGTVPVYLHDTATAADPKAAVLESCAKP